VKHWETAAVAVRRVKGFRHFKAFEGFCKECAQGFSERFKVMESSKGFEVFEVVERKRSNVRLQEDELSGEETDGRNSWWRIHEFL
jgi:hypothetical protein